MPEADAQGEDRAQADAGAAEPETSQEAAAAPESDVPTRPPFLKVIAAFYFLGSLGGLLALMFGPRPYSSAVDPASGRLALLDHWKSLPLMMTEFTGAVLLWRLRRSAFPAFVATCALILFQAWCYPLIRGWMGAMQHTTPDIYDAVTASALNLGICVYLWELRSSGVLK